jgi:hypothetical protein
MTGIAVAFKQVGAVNWPFLVVLYPIVFGGEKRLRNSLSFAIWSGLGAAGVWAIIAIYFSLRGGLNDLIYYVLTHNLEYVQALPWSQRLSYLKSTLAWLSHTQAAAWIFAAAGAVALARARRTKLLLLLLGWTACSMVGVSASGQFFPHYFEQLLPAVCLMAGLGGEALVERRFWGEVSAWGRTGMVCAVLAALPLGTLLPFFFSYTTTQAVQKIYPGDIFAETPLLASRLAQATAPQERVFVFGTEPEVLFYAQRVSATRYIFLYPLYGPYRGVREKQQAAARQIELNRPAAVAYIPNGVLLQSGTEQFFTQWTETYLRENFRGDGCVTRDPVGDAHFLISADGQHFPIPQGHQMIGAIFVRRQAGR